MESGTPAMQMALTRQQANLDVSTHVATRSGEWSEPVKWEKGRLPRPEAKATFPERPLINNPHQSIVEDDAIDVIHDFSIEDGDMLDLSEVAEQFGLSAAEMEAALTLRQIGRDVRVEVETSGESQSLIMIRGVQAAALCKAAPWIFDPEETTAAVTAFEKEPRRADTTAVAESPKKPDAERDQLGGTNATGILVLGAEQSVSDTGRDKLTDADAFVFETKPRDVYRKDVLNFKSSPNETPDFAQIAEAFGLSEDEVMTTIDLSKIKPGLKVQLELDGASHKVAAMNGRDAKNEVDAFPGALVV
ncbi:MAG: type I secretion C-terminal target domain-containing protein [Pseudomonadota bacterium]